MKRPSEAFRSAKLFDTGCGYLVVSRFKADGRVESGFFLLDVFCLGVKDAGFECFNSADDYQKSLLGQLFPDADQMRLTPAAARKLIEDAVSYARDLGFSPGPDYKKASRVFGGIMKADSDEEFAFGKDGKPFYIQGPSDSPASVERVLRTLEARCGEDGYHYIIAGDDFDSLAGEEEDGENALAGSAGRTQLEAMAADLRDNWPGIEVRLDRPGRRKVSDMLAQVAKPLLESAPEFDWKKMILTVTALAWDFTLLEPAAQKAMRVELANLFGCPEGLEIFYYLAARKVLLFPGENCFICEVEAEPTPHGGLTVRVMSATGRDSPADVVMK